ncbi:MAG: SRPBCC family protein [Bacteroidetes bacterium]|nr:SRPBCC family protein [Bacteroidota bacterium]
MHILTTILLVLLGLIALFLLAAFFMKKTYSVERSILIQKPVSEVFDYIKLLKNQNNYATWNSLDPDMKQTYSGTDGTPGFVSAWESNNKKVGAGEQEIKTVIDGAGIETELRFLKPFEGVAQSSLLAKAVTDQQAQVVWRLDSAMKYPMNFLLLFMNMDQLIGKDFEAGLQKLKELLEKA